MDLPARIAEQGGRVVAGLALEHPDDGDGDPRRRDHRRAVHRDQGGARRRLRPRGPRPRPRARAGADDADRRRRRRGPAADRLPDRGGRAERPSSRRSPTRTGASGPTCSPRRCASRATSTPPRRRCRTPTCRALETWARDGVPARPGAWLTTVARRLALNLLRRGRTLEAKLPLLLEPEARTSPSRRTTRSPTTACGSSSPAAIPALAREAQVALTLRLVCGVADGGHRARVPRLRVDDGGADHPREEEDRHRAHPLRGARRRTSCPRGSTRR